MSTGPVTYTLQLLHYSDGEAGLLASRTAPLMAALVDRFEDQFANSITLSGGDNWIPGPFLAAGTDSALNAPLRAIFGNTSIGTAFARPDYAIMNILGTDASALGNHDFDLGSNVLADAIRPVTTGTSQWVGARFPHISANLNFSADAALNPLFTNTFTAAGLEEANTLRGRIVPSAVITEGGERVGLVGATTQILGRISSPTGTTVNGFTDPATARDDMALLASQLQPVIDDLIAQGVNKIVLMSHLQQIGNEQLLATLLRGVDIILSAGSNTRLGDANDVPVAFPGHAANFQGTYPLTATGADGGTTLIVNTDNEYTYLGRLVAGFDAEGRIVTSSLDTTINGAYAATQANVDAAWGANAADAFAAGSKGAQVRQITDAVQGVISAKDGNVFGFTNVYLEGERGFVRSEETNFGNITADANAAALKTALGAGGGDTFVVSLKNGGGIRAQIGALSNAGGVAEKIPPLANAEVGKPGGGVSLLDVENALRFNNGLMAFDTTPAGLLAILEHGVASWPNQGRFPQIGGVRFSWDPTKPAGERVSDVALIDGNDGLLRPLIDNRSVVAGAPTKITVVTLNFLANGGDGYPMKANGENFRFLLNDGTLGAPVDEALNFTATGVVPTNILGEQQALRTFMQANHANQGTAYNVVDSVAARDGRIQNTQQRPDTVLAGVTATYGPGADFRELSALGDTAYGAGGADILYGRDGADSLFGDAGGDMLLGGAGDDAINGGADQDFLFGGDFAGGAIAANSGVDTIDGGDGNDGIWGFDGADQLNGGAGNDVIVAGAGDDTANGGTGDDFIFGGEFVGGGVAADSGADTLNGGDGNDAIWGFDGIDTLTGEAGNDILVGGADNDTLTGGAGNDTLIGDAGADVLAGGAGFDVLVGGEGADTFVFRAGDSYDWVLDFSAAGGDRLRFDPTLAATFTAFRALLVDGTVGGATATIVNIPGGTDQLIVFGVRPTDWTAAMVEFA